MKYRKQLFAKPYLRSRVQSKLFNMSDPKKPFPDPLVQQRIFPEPSEVFDFAPVTLETALKDGVVVIDTNVLLIPYTTGKASLDQIRSTYERLTKENRLRIPGQVAREFAQNRAEKLKILFQQLSRKRDINLVRSEYPLLEGIKAYSDLVKREGEISEALAEYRSKISELLDIVAGWQWNDPVSNIYRDLFKGSTIAEPTFDREELLEDLNYRQEHRIPPGFKDATNEHSGIGDLLIWKTILHLGQQENKHVIFVSGDEKADWRYKSEGQALYPRFELLDEYRRASQGKSLLVISFAQLLEQFGASAPVLAEIKQEEAAVALAAASDESVFWHTAAPSYPRAREAEHAVLRWLLAQFPTEIVESGRSRFPDFVVRTATGAEGYEMTYIFSTQNIVQHVRNVTQFVSKYPESPESMPLNLVIVLESPAATEGALERISVELQKIKAPNLSKVIIGILTAENRFEQRHWVNLRAAVSPVE